MNTKNLMFTVTLIATALIAIYSKTQKTPMYFEIQNLAQDDGDAPFYRIDELNTEQQMAHSPTIARINDKQYLVAYFAGSMEGAEDVGIYASVFNPPEYTVKSNNRFQRRVNIQDVSFGTQRIILTREMLSNQAKQYIKRIGNPVLLTKDGKVYLFVVATNIGGWATSKIYVMESNTHILMEYMQGKTERGVFSLKGHYALSPILNMSNLVRINPMEGSDHILPIYFEMGKKVPALAILDEELNISHILRPNSVQYLMQPSIAPIPFNRREEDAAESHMIGLSDNCLIVYRSNKRGSEGFIHTQKCKVRNGSMDFMPVKVSSIKNLDSSVAIATIGRSTIVVYNESVLNETRGLLSLGIWNGKDFLKIKELDKAAKGQKVSYPNILVSGKYAYIVYDSGSSIKVATLNKSYVDSLKKNKI